MPEIDHIIELARAVRQSTIKRLERIPEGFENWSVSKNALSISEIAGHVIDADEWLLRKLSEPSTPSFKGAKGQIQIANRAEYQKLIENLSIAVENKISCLSKMNDKDLGREIYDDRFGGLVSCWWVIVRGNLDHEIHHRGQLSAYIRVLQDSGVRID